MKIENIFKKAIFLFMLFSCIILNAQEQEKLFLIKKIIDYSEIDSIAKNEYTYNDDANELTHLYQEMNNGSFQNVVLYEKRYNLDGDIVSDQKQRWNGTEWYNTAKTDYKYIEKGVIDTAFHYYWKDSIWILYSFTDYSYDYNKLCTSQETRKLQDDFFWGDYLELWEYDTKGRLTFHSTARYNIDRTEYLNSSGTRYDYDNKGNLIEMVNLNPDYNGRDWEENSKNTYAYNEKNKLIQHLYLQLDAGDWIINMKKTFSYNSENLLSTIFRESRHYYEDYTLFKDALETYYYENGIVKIITTDSWNEQEWVSYSRLVYSYDSNQNEILTVTEKFKDNNWYEKYKCFKTYDPDNNIASVRNQFLDTLEWKNYHTNITVEDSKGRKFSYNKKYAVELDWSYVLAPIGVEENRLIDLSNYPNPASEFSVIQYSLEKPSHVSISLFNSFGINIEKIFEGYQIEGNHKTVVNLSDYTQGAYYIVIKSNNRVTSQKMIIVK